MDEMRSCTQCRYGPSIIDCISAKTGRKRMGAEAAYEMNYLSPSIMYYLDPRYHNNMPCCEPSNESTHGRIANVPVAEVQPIPRGSHCLFCAYGPTVWECSNENISMESRYEAYANDMFNMPCFERENAKHAAKAESIPATSHERPVRSRDDRSNSGKKAITDILIFLVILAILALAVLFLLPQMGY